MNMKVGHYKILGAGAMLWYLSSCTPEGLINKTKYDGKKVVNTCETFQNEVKALIEANAGPNKLRISEYDNSQFDYFFLEPGQLEQKGDTVYFRLIGDLEYGKYLKKGVAVHVNAKYQGQDHLKDIEEDFSGDLGMQVIDEAYFKANQNPFFGYKIPAPKGKLDGKQLILSFSIVQYDKKGKVKKVFCNSVDVPIGPLDASCCTDQPWDEVRPPSIVALPDLDIKDETYRYKGFMGTLDLIFPMSSTKFKKEELMNVITNYIEKYDKEGFKVVNVQIDGYASQGGKVDYNQRLSDARAKAVADYITEYYTNKGISAPPINFTGKGEDWERLDILTKTANFTETERQQILDIAGSAQGQDEKEAQFRLMPHWKKFVTEVLEYCRHTLITFTFDWQPDKMYTDYYPSTLPVISPELYNVSTKTMTIGKYIKGTDANKGLTVLNKLIPNNEKANLYAMRSTYYWGLSDIESAIRDIEKAQILDPNNDQYGIASLAFKTKFAYKYSLTDRMKMLDAYNDYVKKNPNNQGLLLNRAVMMEKVGYLSGAIKQFDVMLSENQNGAAAFNNRGVARLKANRITEAESDFKEAIALDENIAEAHFNLAIVYAYKGLTDKTIDELDRAIALDKSFKDEVFSNPVFNIMRDNPKFGKYRNN